MHPTVKGQQPMPHRVRSLAKGLGSAILDPRCRQRSYANSHRHAISRWRLQHRRAREEGLSVRLFVIEPSFAPNHAGVGMGILRRK
jgi:hypothetical protein